MLTTRTLWTLLAVCIAGAIASACQAPEAAAGGAVAIGAGLGAIVKAVSPALDAAHQQQVVDAVGKASSWIDALHAGVQALSEAVAGGSAKVAALQAQVTEQATRLAAAPTMTDVNTAALIGTGAGIVADRGLSAMKHGHVGKKSA